MAVPVSHRAAQLRDAYFAWKQVRFDAQIVMETMEELTAEEVVIMTNSSGSELTLAPLPLRNSAIQLNWKARDERNENLILLSKDELEAIYREVFNDALDYLRRRGDAPHAICELIWHRKWDRLLFGSAVADALRSDRGLYLEFHRYIDHTVLGSFSRTPTNEEKAVIIFSEYLNGRVFGFYRPWVLLPRPIPPDRPGNFSRCFVKYVVGDRLNAKPWERAAMGALGWVPLRYEPPYEMGGSSHFRLRAPPGLIFDRPYRVPNDWAAMPGTGQLQCYLSVAGARRLQSNGSRRERELRVRFSQSSSIRIVTAALFAVISLMPLVLALLPDTEVSSVQSVTRGNDLEGVIAEVERADIESAASLGLPLAVGLFASAWGHPPVRSFVVTQLVFAVGIVAAWWVAGLDARAGLVAVFSTRSRLSAPLPDVCAVLAVRVERAA